LLFRKKKDDLIMTLAENVKLRPGETVVTRKFTAFHNPVLKKTLFIMGDYTNLNNEEMSQLVSGKSESVL
jgi:hypothetical protein